MFIYTDEEAKKHANEMHQVSAFFFLLTVLLYFGLLFIYTCYVDWNVLVVYCILCIGAFWFVLTSQEL